MTGKVFASAHRIWLTTIVAFGFAALTATSYGFIDLYYAGFARETLKGWLGSQAINIQEGNLLTAITSQERIILLSRFVRGIALYGSNGPRLGHSELIRFGESDANCQAFAQTLPVGKVSLRRIGILSYVVGYQFSDRPQQIVFYIRPDLALRLWCANSAMLGLLLGGLVIYVHRMHRQEDQRRQEILKSALFCLIDSHKPGDDLLRSWPGISNVWNKLSHLITSLQAEVAEHSSSVVIAGMTQMLAHDVRRPFSLLRSAMRILGEAADFEAMSQIVDRLKPEIERSLRQVDGLVADVMAMGAQDPVILCNETNPQNTIDEAVCDLLQQYPDRSTSIRYQLGHSRSMLVDEQKIERVLFNILANAIQASRKQDKIWIHTQDRGPMIEFVIGNSGSFIPDSLQTQVFNAFVTSGKKGGTGLGLAIAKKFVEAHGGLIRCVSVRSNDYPDGKVEFIFTLPAGCRQLGHPKTIEQATHDECNSIANQSQDRTAYRPHQLIKDLITPISQDDRYEVLVVEDNPFILEAWGAALRRDANTYLVRSSEELEQLLVQDPDLLHRLCLVITDFRLEGSAHNGVAIGKKIKSLRPDLLVLLSSDEGCSDDALGGAIDHRIAKEPVGLADLEVLGSAVISTMPRRSHLTQAPS